MDQLISSLPKGVVAAGALLVGFLIIILADPPKTVCGSQMELFREAQKSFLYDVETSHGVVKPSRIKQLHDLCINDNSPGGCFELFEGLKRFAADLENIPAQCSDDAASESNLASWLPKSMKLMVQLAWGERAPASHYQKNGWYDASEIVLFCDLKRNANRILGSEAMKSWTEKTLAGLPEADKLGREVVWQKSVLSSPCDVYR